MHSSPINSALADVRRRLQRPGGWFVPPPAYFAYPMQSISPHAPHGTPIMWTPILYTPQKISTQATFPAVAAIPPSALTHDQPSTPNFTNRPMQSQNSRQNSPLAQATVQPTGSRTQTDANTNITPSSSPHTPSSYAFATSPPHTQNQISPSQPQWRRSHNFKPGSQSSTWPNDALGLQLISGSLCFGFLRWDIRQQPAAARSGDSSFPNLDLPVLPLGVVSAEIGFKNARMKHFTDIWGPIPVQKRLNHHDIVDMTHGTSNPISIRDILEEIYRYFMLPLDDQERAELMSTPQKHEEILAAFIARSQVQSFTYDFYRRADLLPNGLSNFAYVEFTGGGTNSCSLRLRLY